MHHENDKTSCFSNLFSQSEQLKIKLVGVALQSIRVPGGLPSTRHAFVFIIYFILSTLFFSSTCTVSFTFSISLSSQLLRRSKNARSDLPSRFVEPDD